MLTVLLSVYEGQTHSVRQLKEPSFTLSLHPFCQVKQKESCLHPETKHASSGLSAGWMSHADPPSHTHHSNEVIYVDADTKHNVHVTLHHTRLVYGDVLAGCYESFLSTH